MIDIFQYQFMQNALTGIFLASILCGIIGSLIVVNRIVSLAGSIAHSAYGGIGLAFYFGLPIQLMTIVFSAISGLFLARISESASHKTDSYIGILWAFGMALGVILIDLTPGYKIDVMSYLFGNILTITTSDILFSLVIVVVTIFIILFFYDRILLLSFDKDYAKIVGYNVRMLNYLIFLLISISIVILIRMTGIILVMAMLTIPQNIALRRSKSLASMMIVSSILVLILSYLGFYLAYIFNLSAGATIIMVSILIFFLDTVYIYLKQVMENR